MNLRSCIALWLTSLAMATVLMVFPGSAKATHTEVNGCGSGSTRAITPNGVFANFTAACNNHDRCYGELGQSKENCDNAFYNEMARKCESTYDDWWEQPSRELCYGTAEVYYEAVRRAGGDAYRSAQEHAEQNRTDFDKIYLSNRCHRPIFAAIRHQNLDGQWVTRGWYELEPGERAYVVDTRNINLYIYAETAGALESRLYWRGDDRYYTVRDSTERYGFIHKTITTDTWGTWTESFTCN